MVEEGTEGGKQVEAGCLVLRPAGARQVGERCIKVEPQDVMGVCVGSREAQALPDGASIWQVSNTLQAKQAMSVCGFGPRIIRVGSLAGSK